MTEVPQKSRHFTPLRIAAFLLIVVALLAFQGNQKIPTGPASGDGLNGSFPTTNPVGDTIRVAELNIAGGVGKGDGRLDLDRTAAAIRGYDIVGLEEIHGGGILGGHDQAQILGEKLGTPWLFAPVESQWWHDSFGNGVVTALPVEHWQRFPISNAGADTNRNVLILRVKFAGKPLNILITHLDRHGDQMSELTTVISLFECLNEPAILMGDLNTEGSNQQITAEITALRKTPGIADPIGDAMGDKAIGNLDWIFARGMTVVRSGTTDNGASDHYLAWAELR